MELVVDYAIEITDENLDIILEMAFEGGITYWCSEATETGNFAYKLYDYVDDKEWSFNKKDLLNGISMYILNHRNGFKLIKNENGKMVFDDWNVDGNVADEIIQYACMGKVRYG